VEFIAEVGSNHMGSYHLAIEHIKAAARAGATHVKFQVFRAETLDARPEKQIKLKALELPLEWLTGLRMMAHNKHLKFGVSIFDVSLVEKVAGDVDYFKISAYDLTYFDLIEAVAKTGLPIILSTAMATWTEIYCATARALRFSRAPVSLLHGVACYPALATDMNLRVIAVLKDTFQNCHVGLSDHTLGKETAVLATACGAEIIEKHFWTDALVDKKHPSQSPDFLHSASFDEFKNMVAAVKTAEKMLGKGEKEGPLPCEMPLYETARRTNEKPLRGL
jgi:N,N'-diacetyllegionaminate synthase